MPHLRRLYVLADGGRARLVERAPETGAFVTFEELEDHPQVRAGSPGRSFQSATPERHALGREDAPRQAKEAFMDKVAERAALACAERAVTEVWVAAPDRLIGRLRAALTERRLQTVPLNRDLTKTPDHALGRWLDRLVP